MRIIFVIGAVLGVGLVLSVGSAAQQGECSVTVQE